MPRHTRPSGWAVAGAWLLLADEPLPIGTLKAYVLEYGISGLTKSGGLTPKPTLGVQLRKLPGLFVSKSRGTCELTDRKFALEHPDIQWALLTVVNAVIDEYAELVRRLASRSWKLHENESRLKELEAWLHRAARLQATHE